GEVAFELSQRARPDDRKRTFGRHPGDRDFAGCNAGVVGNCHQRVEDGGALWGVFRLEYPSAETLCTALLTLAVLARQHASAKRRPGHDAEAERLAGRKKLQLGGAFDQAMLDLEARDGGGTAQLGDGRGPRHAPGGKVGETSVEDLPC